MKKVVIVLLLLTAAVAAVLVYYTLVKPAPKAADLLPESTLVFLDFPDFSQSRADFTKTELYALWHEPEVQAFLEKPLASLHEVLVNLGAPKEENAMAEQILDAMQGEVFVALTRVTIPFNPSVVVGVDVRRKRIEAAAALYALENNLKSSNPTGKFEESKFLGVKYVIWEVRPGLLICHASFNSLFVFTLGEDTMRDLIACYTGQTPRGFKPLSASTKYRNVLQCTGKSSEFLAYCSVEDVLTVPSIGMMLAVAPQTSGVYQKLSRLQTSAASMTFVDRGIEDVGFMAYSSAAPEPTEATRQKALALTTPETLLYWTSSADLAKMYDEAMQSLSQSGNANMMAAVGQFQQGLRNQGVRIREDVLQKLGPECTVLGDWRPGTRVPDCAIISEVANATQLQPALDGVMNALKSATWGDDSPWDETEYAGRKLRTAHVGTGVVAPTYTITDQFFILASTPDYARQLVAQIKDTKPTLAQSERYAQAMKRLPAGGSSYLYADLRGVFEPLYALGKETWSQAGENDFVDLKKLPSSPTIAKHLFPFVSATVSEERQEMTTTFSPFGKALTLAAGIGGAIWVSDIFGPTLKQFTPPALKTDSERALPRTSSDTAVPSVPRESQTAESQTPTTQ